MVGIRPDREPDDDLQPGPLPLIGEFTMSLFTLLYVGPILTIMYYLFCWGKSTAAGRTIMVMVQNKLGLSCAKLRLSWASLSRMHYHWKLNIQSIYSLKKISYVFFSSDGMWSTHYNSPSSSSSPAIIYWTSQSKAVNSKLFCDWLTIIHRPLAKYNLMLF